MATETSFGTSFSDIIGGIQGIIGSGSSGSQVGTGSSKTSATASGEQRERLDISDEAVDKIISDILSGPDGLAEIFAGEQNAGIFNSSVANLAAGDLAAQVTGEIAKLRAEKILTNKQKQEQETEQESKTTTKTKQDGILDTLFG